MTTNRVESDTETDRPTAKSSPVDRVLIGLVTLSELPIKDRRAVARQLLVRSDTDPIAEGLLTELLRGPIPVARPIGRIVSNSKKRALLLRAWITKLGDMASTYRTDRSLFDAKEVAARGQWIAKQLVKMRTVPGDLAEQLLKATVNLAVILPELPSGQSAESSLADVALALRKWIERFDDDVVDVVARAAAPYRARASFLRTLDASATRGSQLISKARDVSLKRDAEFAEYLFSTIPDRRLRSEELSRSIRAGCDPKIAEQVIQELLSRSSNESRSAYLEPILSLALESNSLSPGLLSNVVGLLDAGTDGQTATGPLWSVFSQMGANLASRHNDMVERIRGEHHDELGEATSRITSLEQEVAALNQLVESVKKAAKEPELQTEYRVLATAMTSMCLIHQEMVLAIRERPDLRLSALAQTLRGALVRQGLKPIGAPGEVLEFDAAKHEYGRWIRQPGNPVKIVTEGYCLAHPVLGTVDVLVRAIVEPQAGA